MQTRGSGVLLHISSLPSRFGIGDFGPGAHAFADFLALAGQSYWQILPLAPTGTFLGNSPYNGYSAFAGNPLFISPEALIMDGLLSTQDVENVPDFGSGKIPYRTAIDYKKFILRKAFDNFRSRTGAHHEFDDFCSAQAWWLDDFCLFAGLKDLYHESAWYDWPDAVRDRSSDALSRLRQELADRILLSKFYQYCFSKQWLSLRQYCSERKIKIIGDIPIYISEDSADVWTNPQLFKLDEKKHPLFVAGAPPDYFSPTGQRWGNPVYRWDVLEQTGFEWWLRRVERNLALFDIVRIDHFRGFVAYWEIPASEKTAVNGKWIDAPAMNFFVKVTQRFPSLPLIVEDLGLITPDVKKVIAHFGFPGMKVLQFAFTEDLATNPYAPHNHVRNCVVYTGTHDNNTVRGWFARELGAEGKERFFEYIGREISEEQAPREMIRLALQSVARTAILSMPDILGLGEEARMNLPAELSGNWEWRLDPNSLTPELASSLAAITRLYGR